MAVSHVQAAANIAAASTTLTVTLTSVAAGDLLIGGFRFSGTAPANAVADTVNGNWTQIAGATISASNVYLYYVVATGAASNLVVTCTAGASGTIRMAVDQFTGAASWTQHLADTGTSATATNWPTTPGAGGHTPLSPAAGEFGFAYAATGTNSTVTAGFENQGVGAAMALGGNQSGANGSIAAEYLLSTTGGASSFEPNLTWGIANSANGGYAAFTFTLPASFLAPRPLVVNQAMKRGFW